MLICSNCGRESPDGFSFCGYCSASLRDELATTLEERKVVSVLFSDLVGFTAASEQQDPEDVRARIRTYHARLRQEIERYAGTVEKFVGDAVMAVFGAPVAHEDDVERAVRAGLRILEAIAELNQADPELDLQVRIGINTGEAVVAMGARADLGEGLVTGDVVNTAARIQGAAPPNAVAVSAQTYRATSRFFEYEPLEPVSVKGKANLLELWRPIAARSRFGSDIVGEFKTPFIGRELEKPLVIGTFERAARQPSVQLLTIIGEPGVGKTRLISELADHVDAKPGITRWRQGRCLPYGEGITFWALGEVVKAEAGILESDSAEVAAAKLEAAVAPNEPERQWLVQRLAPLVGVEATSPAERQELFTAWRRYLEGLAAARSSVLVFEDLHWADDALLDFLEHLVEWSQGVPLLVLCAARPELYERRQGWSAGQRNAQTINLSPLTDQETAELVSHLISATTLSPELELAVLERAGGNPLYAEEFVRLLADRGPDGAGVLPESVQALIAARLDTLSADRKNLLQDAAVMGKVFWAGALGDMGDRVVEEVELALHELALKELVRPARTSSMEGESEYSFWHVLIRDVAYSQIPRAERARRHRAAAAWIERKGGERVEDLAEVLAHHYVQALELAEAAGEAEQAAEVVTSARRFLVLAGERALGLDTVQAEARLARALTLVAPDEAEHSQLLVRWLDAVAQSGRSREAADALDDALRALRQGGDAETAALALRVRSRVSVRLGDGRGVDLAAEAVELLEQEPPGPALVAAYEQLASAQWLGGSFADAVASIDRVRTLAAELGLPEPARAMGYRGMARAYLGEVEGIDEMERALELLSESGAGRDAAVVQNNLAVARYPIEGPSPSLAAFEAGIRFCRQRGLVEAETLLISNCPGLRAELGRVDEALAQAAELAAAHEKTGRVTDLLEVRSLELALRSARGEPWTNDEAEWLVESALRAGHVDLTTFALASAAGALGAVAPGRAREILVKIGREPGTSDSPYYARQLAGMVRTALAAEDDALARQLVEALGGHFPLHGHARCAARAQLAEAAGELSEAAIQYGEAAGRWHEFGHVPERAYSRLGQGRCLVVLGSADAAEPLSEARSLFTELGYTPAVEETEALLGRATAAQRS